MTATTTAEAKQRTQEDVVRELVATLAQDHFGSGPLADLRRADPRAACPTSPTLLRLLARHVPDDWLGGDGLRRWALLIHMLALAAPSPQHNFTALGEALFAAGYSEGRLTKVLEAQEKDFAVTLPRMVRFIIAKGGSPHPYQLARLVLGGGRDVDRLAIARTFYRTEARSST